MKTKPIKRILINTVVVGVLLLSIVACAKESETKGETKTDIVPESQSTEVKEKEWVTLNLGYPIAGVDFIGGIAGIAQELGYLDEELDAVGYKISYQGFSGAGPAVNEALAGGKIDFALYADFPGIVIKSKGVDVQLLSIVSQVNHAGIVVGKDSLIQSIADLKGKKIAFPKGTFVQKYLLQALETYGINESDVELINMTTDAESALLGGSVDAVAHVDLFLAKLAYGEAGAKIINTSRENQDWSGASILIGRGDYLKEHRVAAVAFIKALVRAKKYADSNPEEIYQLFSDKQKISLDASKYLNNLDNNSFEYYSLDVGTSGMDKLSSNKQFLLDSGLIQDDFDVSTWGDNSYYEEAILGIDQ